jgi:hypothetical protein
VSDEDEDDGADWWQQQDNEARRWAEEEAALNRCRKLTQELRDETRLFEHDMQQLDKSIRSTPCLKLAR